MTRTHLIVVSGMLHNTPVESRLLIQMNSSRLAALAALHKLCPQGQLLTTTTSPIGSKVWHGAAVYTVSFVQSVKPSDMPILYRYYPVCLPDERALQEWVARSVGY